MMTSGENSVGMPVPRQVCVAIAYRFVDKKTPRVRVEYLLVSSRKHQNFWVLPKGGIEPDELSNPGLAALREAWEEGGIRGKLVRFIHNSMDAKVHRDMKKTMKKIFIPRAEYSFWLIEVDDESGIESSWPEENERRRQWVGRQEAIDLVKWRQDGAVDALIKVDEQVILAGKAVG